MIDSLRRTDDGQFLEALFDAIQDGLIVLDLESRIVVANRWMEERYPAKLPLQGKKCYEALHDREEPCTECELALALETGQPRSRLSRSSSNVDPDAWFEICSYPLLDAEDTPIGSVEHIRDVSELKQAEDRASDEAAWRRLLVDQSRDGIVVMDLNGKVYEANQRFARMLGYSMAEVYELHVWDWDTEYDKKDLLEMIAAVDEDGAHFETTHRRKDGTKFAVELSSNGAVYGERKFVFCVCRDVSERKALEARVRELAVRDPLTNVYNRRHVFERLEETAAEYLRTECPFSVSILDLDHFKILNDANGHLAGDFALKEFACTLAGLIRPYDILARFGGEEFMIVSRGTGAAETTKMIERIMTEIRAKPFEFEDRAMPITFSCGVAESSEFDIDDFSVQAVVGLADQRLYEAKRAGRDRCVGPCFVRTSS